MFLNPKKINKILEELNPDRIYVENIRHILGTNTRFAKWVCDIAVRNGYLKKFYAIECPNSNCNRIIQTYSSLDKIPDELTCFMCEDDGLEKSTFLKKNLNIIPFYKYVKGSYQFA
ncbi:hypothetical protein [Maribacter sp. LLG6340-A2]|uniref:hypothetical protein n=1 Tax=Maribacter sp. LLG6340-A2 TaxID=3160834 RepID=UPI00386496DB